MFKNYGMEIVRATEIAALSAARLQGFGDKEELLSYSREAMSKSLNKLQVDGIIKNDRFKTRPNCFPLPETVGGGGPRLDIMAVALEAHNSTSNGKYNAASYVAIAKEGSILKVPNLFMSQMVVGPECHQVIDINLSPTVNIKRVARALKTYTENVTVCILEHENHKELIEEVRQCGARIKMIAEGVVSGCLAAIMGKKIDLYIGYGYAPEAVMVAAAIRCLGGYLEGKILYENEADKQKARQVGIKNFEKSYRVEDLISTQEVAFAGTGITDGEFLEGIRFTSNGAVTHSFVGRGETRTYRKLETRHFFDYKPIY